jgi:hypothetical protein
MAQKGNARRQQVTLTVLIAPKDNRSVPAYLEVTLPSETLNSACKIVVSGLAREDKERLLHELARECGYHLEPVRQIPEDFQRKLFLDNID